MQEIFKRVEKKYMVTEEQKKQILEKIHDYIRIDKYGPSTICNIYFDSESHDLIRASLDKPIYKEKVRMRSYNVPNEDTEVFLEIKKKFDGVVYKRRISSSLKSIENYLKYGTEVECNPQIKKEIDYCFEYYHLKPTLFLAYDRIAYYDKTNDEFRISFDTNIISREYDLALEKGVYGDKLIDDGTYIMEVKCSDGYPMWFVEVLEELKIYPHSFSKYGTIYEESFKKEKSTVYAEAKYENEETRVAAFANHALARATA